MSGAGWLTAATGLAVVALVAAHLAEHRSRRLWKPLASVGFVTIGLASGPDGVVDWMIVAGLTAGAVGDVALMGDTDGWFLAGMGAFATGHALYGMAWAPTATPGPLMVGLAIGFGVGMLTWRWLQPRLGGPLRPAVAGYVGIIAAMLATAIGNATSSGLVVAGGTTFALSDLFVARERFVTSDRRNAALGLPLYYLAQVAIAWSVGG